MALGDLDSRAAAITGDLVARGGGIVEGSLLARCISATRAESPHGPDGRTIAEHLSS